MHRRCHRRLNPIVTPTLLIFALLGGFAGAALFGPIFIPLLRRWKIGQTIREEMPERHQQEKQGTPTIGGLIFLGGLGLITVVLVAAGLWRPSAAFWAFLAVTGGYGLVGFIDDYIKVVLRRPLGLRAREKLLGQVLVGVGLGLFAQHVLGLSTSVAIPFTAASIDLGWAYIAFVAFVLLATANAVNLTDGLDGLAAGASMITYGAYAWIAWQAGEGSLAAGALAMTGALGGFLLFNRHPAQVIMGDAGSLALGGGLAALAVLTKAELTLVLVGGLFAVETLSVIIQVTSFRLTGKRVFRMSPIHYHFELGGWTERQVVTRFWLFAALCAAIGLLGLPASPALPL